MSTQIETVKTRTAKPVVAGVFDIVFGSFCLLGVLVLFILGIVFMPVVNDVSFRVGFILWIVAIPLAAIGVVSVLGGIYSLQRRMWGLALAGSITTALVSQPFGIASIVLTAVSKDEFAK